MIDSPLAELSIVGVGIGAALYGMHPICEVQFADFIYPAFNQIVSEAAKMRYLSAGRLSMPIVMRASAGGGLGFGAQHSQTLESWFMSTPGLSVVSPSGPASRR